MIRSLLTLALIFSSRPAMAICEAKDLEEQVGAAEFVFVATVTTASIQEDSLLKNGEPYRIIYSFVVRESLKGDSSRITSLYTMRVYDDPSDSVSWSQAEETRLVPGDNVLVLAGSAGDVQVGYCTPSRPLVEETWVTRARAALAL